MNPGLLHYHFESKQAVLVALAERLAERVRQRFSHRLEEAGSDPRERLYAFLNALVAKDADASPTSVAVWVAIGTEAGRKPEVGVVYRRLLDEEKAVLVELVTAVLDAEGLRRAGADAIAAGLLAAVEGAFRLGVSAPAIIPPGTAAGTLRRMAAGLLESQRPSPVDSGYH